MSAPVLQLVDVTLKVNGLRLLSHGNLSLESGQWLGISGPSGAGKSTLLEAVLGVHPLDTGQITLCGQPVKDRAPGQQSGYLPQTLPEIELTVAEFLARPRRFAANRDTRALAPAPILAALGLGSDLLPRSLKDLSGGQRQRVAAACCLQFDRPVLLADEPTSALDPASKQQLQAYLKSRRITVISVSHDSDWLAACDRQVALRDGRLEEVGAP